VTFQCVERNPIANTKYRKDYASCQFVRSDRELCRKTYDLHVWALQKPFIEFERESPGCRSLCIVAQRWNPGGLGVEKVACNGVGPS
jgi:hypothetical protein